MQDSSIRFVHRGAIVEIDAAMPQRSVLAWLREDARCTGSKEGCNEGDCGACTVVIAERAGHARAIGTASARASIVGELSLRTVNACIQFMPTLHGKALLTVEDLQAIAGGAGCLHPVQQALVDCHGSQCGFCTPGFAMSLAACYERHGEAGTRPTRGELADVLSGNLCRCTGYRPILDAGERMFELPPRRLDTGRIAELLERIEDDTAPDASTHAGPFHAPRTLEALAALREARPQATLLAGCTDIGLWANKQLRDLGEIVYLGGVDELKRIEWQGELLRIGAGAPLEDAWLALAEISPEFLDMGRRFASPPVRHAGTMGGNVANGSPIGDSAPVLLALDAGLVLRRGARQRRMALGEFYVDYMKSRLEPGEFIEAIEIPRPDAATQLRAYKLGKRFDCDISAVATGLALTLDGGTVRQARFAFGGMAAIVKRAAAAEAAVVGRPWDEATARAAMAALATDFAPLSDLRASAGYRLRAAQNLLMRLWLETRPAAPLAASQTRVWAAA